MASATGALAATAIPATSSRIYLRNAQFDFTLVVMVAVWALGYDDAATWDALVRVVAPDPVTSTTAPVASATAPG